MACNGHHATVQQLIEAKADLGDTALIWVACNGHHAVVQQLIEAKADLDDTALIRVACNGHHATVQHFIEAKADLDISDGNGNTVLIWVARNERYLPLLRAMPPTDLEPRHGPVTWTAAVRGTVAISSDFRSSGQYGTAAVRGTDRPTSPEWRQGRLEERRLQLPSAMLTKRDIYGDMGIYSLLRLGCAVELTPAPAAGMGC